jgi:hypothetical protein
LLSGTQEKVSVARCRTYSSVLQDNGEDVKVKQAPLRHSSSKMTLDVYAGAHPNQASGAAQGGRDDRGSSQCAAEHEEILSRFKTLFNREMTPQEKKAFFSWIKSPHCP